jgi:hypothetical protein
MLLSRIAPVGALLLLSTVAGCTLPASSEDATASTEALSSETFTLYTGVEPNLSSRCDIHTILTLSSRRGIEVKDPFTTGTILYAHLYNEATGECGVRMDPDPRDYALIVTSEDCGSIVYSASTTTDGTARDITLTDNRKRVCKDFVPAKIVVEEREEGAVLRTLYSFDKKRTLPTS